MEALKEAELELTECTHTGFVWVREQNLEEAV